MLLLIRDSTRPPGRKERWRPEWKHDAPPAVTALSSSPWPGHVVSPVLLGHATEARTLTGSQDISPDIALPMGWSSGVACLPLSSVAAVVVIVDIVVRGHGVVFRYCRHRPTSAAHGGQCGTYLSCRPSLPKGSFTRGRIHGPVRSTYLANGDNMGLLMYRWKNRHLPYGQLMDRQSSLIMARAPTRLTCERRSQGRRPGASRHNWMGEQRCAEGRSITAT